MDLITILIRKLTRWQLGLEHIHSNDVDDEHPDGAVEKIGVRLDEGDSTEALCLQSSAIRIRTAQLTVNV